MLYLMAPPLHQPRHKWLEAYTTTREWKLFLVESGGLEASLRQSGYKGEIRHYNEHTKQADLLALKPYFEGSVGLLSDGGFPCLGDPGWELVRECHKWGVKLTTRGVHSYVMAALLMSGCSGNKFSFTGYLPKEKNARQLELKKLLSLRQGETLVMIETPYRFLYLLEDVLELFPAKAWMSLALSIGSPDERIIADSVEAIKKSRPKLPEKPLGVIVIEIPRTPQSAS